MQAQDIMTQQSESNSPKSEQYEKIEVNGKKLYNCLVANCGKKFKYKSDMERHQTIHSDSRPYSCTFPNCDKKFKRPDALHSHLRIHIRTPPFECPVSQCGSLFNTKSALQYHMLKHKGERAFKCNFPGCDKAFFTITHLKQHEKALCYHQKMRLLGQTDQSLFHSPTLIFSPLELVLGSHGSCKFESNDFKIKTENPNNDLNLESLVKKEESESQTSTQNSPPFVYKPSGKLEFNFANNLTRQFNSMNGFDLSNDHKQDHYLNLLKVLKEENFKLKRQIQQNMGLLQNNIQEYDIVEKKRLTENYLMINMKVE